MRIIQVLLLMILFIPGMISSAIYKSCASGKRCVPYELCNEVRELDVHFYPEGIRTQLDDQDCHYMEKCCSAQNTLSVSRNYSVSLLQQGTCGHRLEHWFHLHPLTHTEQEVKFAEFPWLVGIYNAGGYLCSGALITPLCVLTAAHCVQGEPKDELRLVAGEWDAAVELEPLSHQTRSVAELLVHPKYMLSLARHNLALLLLHPKEPFELTANVQVICLPSPQIIHNLGDCFVAGWSRMDFHRNMTLPKRSSLFLLPRDQCASKLRLAILGRRNALNDTLLCASGEKNHFVCGNLGVIPLMCHLSGSSNRFVLVGLLARAARCDRPQLLGIYTNVMLYRSWIDLKLKERELDTRGYMIDEHD